MKTTVLYFNSESEVKEYAEKNGYKYIDNYLEDRREEWGGLSITSPLQRLTAARWVT